jgi:LAO/AO transport system kinase
VISPATDGRAAPDAVEAWVAQVRAGDVRALARAITAIENQEPQAEALLEQLFPATGQAFLIGVTGAPGTGKSTLVDRLAAAYRARNHTVGIIAVDPTSPYSGGAVLGDRIRMQNHAGDTGVFIRSMATRGFLGGLARATADVALLLDAAGKEVIFLETVGVGQDEVDIVRLADCTLVLMVPGLGDDVQSMKAGLMEVADIFVLNKAERDGADRLQQQIEAMLELAPARSGWKIPVVRTTATEGAGVPELVETIEKFRRRAELAAERQSRVASHWKQRLRVLLGEHLLEQVIAKSGGERVLDSLAGDVAERRANPYTAVRDLAARAGL